MPEIQKLVRSGDYPAALTLIETILQNKTADTAIYISALIARGDIHRLRGEFTQAKSIADKALHMAEDIADKALEQKVCVLLGNIAINQGDYAHALEYLQAALYYTEKKGDMAGIASVSSNIGAVYGMRGEWHKSLEYLEQALQIYSDQQNESGMIRLYGMLGNVHKGLGNYDLALDYMAKSLDGYEKMGHRSAWAVTLGNIGSVYVQLGDFDHALEYLQQAINVHEQLGEISSAARVSGNIGVVYRNKGMYQRAEEYYNRAISLHEQCGEKSGMAIITGNLGIMYMHMRLYEKAAEYMKKSLIMHQDLSENTGIASMLTNLGELYVEKKYAGHNLDKAAAYLKESVEINEKYGAKGQNIQNYKLLADIFQEKEEWQQSALFFRSFYQLEQQVLSEKAHKRAEELSYELKKAEKEKETAVEKARQEEREAALLEMTRLNKSLTDTIYNTEYLNSRLMNAVKAYNEVLGIVAHDLKNPLTSILLNISALQRNKKSIENDESAILLERIVAIAGRMRSIIDQLLYIDMQDAGLMKMQLADIDIIPVIRQLCDENSQKAVQKNIIIQQNIPASLPKVKADASGVARIIDNLLSNALKFSPEGSEIDIECSVHDQSIILSVQDNGPGIHPDEIHLLFEKYSTLQAKPTAGEDSTGLGLSICYSLAQKMGANLSYKSGSDKGARFYLELNIANTEE